MRGLLALEPWVLPLSWGQGMDYQEFLCALLHYPPPSDSSQAGTQAPNLSWMLRHLP